MSDRGLYETRRPYVRTNDSAADDNDVTLVYLIR